MPNLIEEQSNSIDELYKFIYIIEGCLEDLEKRISELEKNSKCNDYSRY